MKKKITMITLILAMIISSGPFWNTAESTVYADYVNNPAETVELLYWNPTANDYVQNEYGDRLYETVYNEFTDINISKNGVSFNPARNTVTLTNCNYPYMKLYISGAGPNSDVANHNISGTVNINIVGTCNLMQIDTNGPALNFTGNGTLKVNEKGIMGPAVEAMTRISIENSVTMTCYAGVNPKDFKDEIGTLCLTHSGGNSAKDAFIFSGKTSKYTVSGLFKNGLIIKESPFVHTPAPDNSVSNGYKAKVKGVSYTVLSSSDSTAAFTKAKNTKNVTVPATIKIKGKSYKVTQINAKAFTGKSIRNVTIGKNVKKIKKNAFKGSKATKIILKTKKLAKKASVKGALKGSKIKTVQVKVGKKSVNKKYVKKYKKVFTKKNAGKKVAVKI